MSTRGSRRPQRTPMSKTRIGASVLLACVPLAIALACSARPATAAPAQPPAGTATRLTIERLYSLPWVAGTRPESTQWSPDSRRVAFLWNDEGTNFYDVWLTDVATATPVRVTSMPRPASPVSPGTDVGSLEQVARAETDRGVSELMWAPDGRHLIFNLHGALYRVMPGHTPERLGSESAATDIAASPGANALAYLSGGDLWVLRLGDATSVATRVYAPGRNDVGVESFSWSRDGKRIAIIEADTSRVAVREIPDYLADETRLVPTKRAFPGEPSAARRLGIGPVGGGTPTWIDLGTDPLDEISSISWSSDSCALLVDKSDVYIKDRRLLVV